MKKEFNIVGLDCGHCALTLEKYLEKINGVKQCNINFSTSKLFLEIEDDCYRETIKQIFKTAKQVNPDVCISENKDESLNIGVFDICLYVFGLLIGFIVILCQLSPELYYVLLTLSALCMGYKTYWKAILQLRYLKVKKYSGSHS